MESKIIQLPGEENIDKLVLTIDNFLSDKECDNFLKLINNNDFQKAPIGDKHKSIESETRNNSIGKDRGIFSNLIVKKRIATTIRHDAVNDFKIEKISFMDAYLQMP